MNLNYILPQYIKQINDYAKKHRFTVFTPVYNAQNTIMRVHDSLISQTFTDFEWLIINDGSTDNSDKVITNIILNSNLNINYVSNPKNNHKMACFMQAIDLSKGEFFLTLDADDECIPTSLEVFNKEYNEIPEQLKDKTIAVTGLCQDQYGNMIGDKFQKEPYFSDPFKIVALEKIKGEKWGFTKTTILKGVIYDESFIKNGFMSEGIIWTLLAKEGYQTKYFNKVLRIYNVGVENSISASEPAKTALGTALLNIAFFNWFFTSYFFRSPVFFLKNLYFLLRESNYLPFNLNTYIISLESRTIKFLIVLLWPFRKFFKY